MIDKKNMSCILANKAIMFFCEVPTESFPPAPLCHPDDEQSQ